jgi:hypothetical protein
MAKKTEPTPDQIDASKTDDVIEAPDPAQTDPVVVDFTDAISEIPVDPDTVTDQEIDEALTETPAPVEEPAAKPCLCSYTLQEIANHLVGRTASGSIAVDRGGIIVQSAWKDGAFILDQGV